jgi:hypothetical protein
LTRNRQTPHACALHRQNFLDIAAAGVVALDQVLKLFQVVGPRTVQPDHAFKLRAHGGLRFGVGLGEAVFELETIAAYLNAWLFDFDYNDRQTVNKTDQIRSASIKLAGDRHLAHEQKIVRVRIFPIDDAHPLRLHSAPLTIRDRDRDAISQQLPNISVRRRSWSG